MGNRRRLLPMSMGKRESHISGTCPFISICPIPGTMSSAPSPRRKSGRTSSSTAERMWRGFFTEREAAALEQAGEERETRERLFYRLWARKEAYGKLTGKGIAAALEVDFLPGGTVSSPYGCSSGEVGGKRLLCLKGQTLIQNKPSI